MTTDQGKPRHKAVFLGIDQGGGRRSLLRYSGQTITWDDTAKAYEIKIGKWNIRSTDIKIFDDFRAVFTWIQRG